MSTDTTIDPMSAGFTGYALCGAAPRGKRTHTCGQPAMANGRCRFHGGLSTGPKTKAGRERSRRARLTHGERSAAAGARRRAMAALLGALRDAKNATARGEATQAVLAAIEALNGDAQ